MTYTLFFIPDYQFQKVFLGNNFFTVFVEAPYLWRPGATAQFAPLLNPAQFICSLLR